MGILDKGKILFQLNNIQAKPQISWEQYHILRKVYMIIKHHYGK